MSLETTKDLFYLALAFGVFGISGFLCWGLYEIARLLRQANEIVFDARDKIAKIERIVLTIVEKVEASMNMLTALSSGWKTIAAMIEKRMGVKTTRSSSPFGKKKVSKDEAEEADEE